MRREPPLLDKVCLTGQDKCCRQNQSQHAHVASDADDGRVASKKSTFAARRPTGSATRVVRVLGDAEERRAALEREHGLRDGALDEGNAAGLTAHTRAEYDQEVSSACL